MDEEGLVRSTLEPSTSGPARRNYELTDKGRDALAVFAASMGEVAVALAAYSRRYARLTGEHEMTR
jgi:PadR family transcriptional regulator PadR